MQRPHEVNDRASTSAGLNESAKGLGREAARHARSVAESGKAKLADGAEGVAEALRHASEGLRSDEQEELARYTRSVADKIDLAAAAIKSRSLAAVVTDVSQLAKRQPALFLGGAFTAGLVLARFLKSSSAESSHARSSSAASSLSETAAPSGQTLVDVVANAGAATPWNGGQIGESRDDQALLDEVTAPSGFGPAPGGYGPASAPAGAHGGAGTFGAEGAGGGPGNRGERHSTADRGDGDDR